MRHDGRQQIVTEDESRIRRSIPAWVIAVAVALAAIEPLSHVWIEHYPPADSVPTGLRSADSAYYLASMRMFRTGFESPYATCKAPYGTRSIRYYAHPAYWLYGILGVAADTLGLSDFTALGLGNGLAALCYLLAVYCFLREYVPKHASLAYALFVLGGGLGGIAYVALCVAGIQWTPGLEDAFFRRFAMYELLEGPSLPPVLHNVRLYYTASLAFCFGGLAAFAKSLRLPCRRHFTFALTLLFLGTFLNLRYGAFAWVIATLWLLCNRDGFVERPIRTAAVTAIPVTLGVVLSWLLTQASPSLASNTSQTVRQSIWLTPMLSAACFQLPLASCEVARCIKAMRGVARVAAWLLVGYLGAFLVLFCAYQTYHGNWLVARDGIVSDAISDWALLGVLAGLGAALLLRKRGASQTELLDWTALWLLLFLAAGLSAFGQGRFGQLAPQRLIVFLGVPLAILSAATLERLHAVHPRWARTLVAVILVCGLSSIAVGSLCFQGPLGQRPGKGPFADIHVELMTEADAAVLERLKPGMVLCPEPFGDIIAQRPGSSAILGRGMMQADQLYAAMRRDVESFFSVSASTETRESFVREWCIDFVFWPDSRPVDTAVIEQLRQVPWLQEIASDGKAVLFRVTLPPDSEKSGA